MLTDPGDLVVDPFAGSCVTGEVAERLGRQWICVDAEEAYLKGALVRFAESSRNTRSTEYKVSNPSALWTDETLSPLDAEGGKKRKRD